MLSITSSAAEVVQSIRSEQGLPEHFGLRVFPQETPEGVKVQVAFSETPAEGDEVAEAAGTQLFVAQELAAPLSDAVIDTQDTPEGTGLVFRTTEQT